MNITALLLNYFDNSGEQNNHINMFVANAIYYVIQNFFIKMAPSFVLTLCCRNSHTCNFYNDMLEKLFKIWTAPEPLMQIVIVPENNTQQIPGRRDYNLILTDSFAAFLDIDIVSHTAQYNNNEFYLIFLQTRDHLINAEMQSIFEYCWTHYLINCNVQIQNASGEVLIYTYFPFTAEHCGQIKPVLVNQYNGSTLLVDELFPKKLRNFHGCTLTAALWDVPPFVYLRTNSDGSSSITGGVEAKLLLQLAKRLNFSIAIIIPPNNEQRGNVMGRTGALGMLMNRSVHLSLGSLRQTVERATILTSTDSYYQSTQSVSILISDYNLTSMQSLLYPFQARTWFFILGTCAFFIFGTFLANKYYQRLPQNFIDYRTEHSYLNFLLLTLGMPATYISACFYGRLNALNWMIFALVIRTVYQALLFHLIRTHQHTRLPQTLDDLVDDNYTIVMNRATFDSLINIPYIHALPNLILNSSSDTIAFEYHLNVPHKKLVAAGPIDFVRYLARQQNLAGVFKILDQDIISYQTTMYLCKHSFLVDQFNEEVMWMSVVGLVDLWSNAEYDLNYLRSHHLRTEKVFGLQDLSMVFVIGAGALSFALLVFLAEIFSNRFTFLRSLFQKL